MLSLNIAGNLKRLRKERGITQEDLADFIGVSFQAVSKWERGETYPDITVLPALANFFGVTVDELMGMNEIRDAAKIEEIKQQAESMYRGGGKGNEAIELLREALKIYPNDYGLLAKLADFLSWNYYVENHDDEIWKKNSAEAVKISERVLKFCTDTEIRGYVQAMLCGNLFRSGETGKAVELAKKLPHIYETREFHLPGLLSGKEQLEETQKTISALSGALKNQIWLNLLGHGRSNSQYTPEEKIELCKKIIDIQEIIFEEKGTSFIDMEIHGYISSLHIRLGQTDEAIAALEKMAEQAIFQSNLPEAIEYKSLLVNTLTKKREASAVSGGNPEGKNMAHLYKNAIEKDTRFAAIKDDERFQRILYRLGEYAD